MKADSKEVRESTPPQSLITSILRKNSPNFEAQPINRNENINEEENRMSKLPSPPVLLVKPRCH